MYHSYFHASNLQNCSTNNHLAFLYANVDSRLASHVAVNNVEGIGMYDDDEDSLSNILVKFFEAAHPMYARRSAIFNTKREPTQCYSAYFKKIIKLCKEARTDQISTETLISTFLANTVSHEALRHELLTEEELTFEYCVSLAISFENTNKGRPGNAPSANTNATQGNQNKGRGQNQRGQQTGLPCTYCKKTNHTFPQCRARNNVCVRCGRIGHFAPQCPTTQNTSNQQNNRRPSIPGPRGRANALTHNNPQFSGPPPNHNSLQHNSTFLDASRQTVHPTEYGMQNPIGFPSAPPSTIAHGSVNAVNTFDDPYMFCPKVQL